MWQASALWRSLRSLNGSPGGNKETTLVRGNAKLLELRMQEELRRHRTWARVIFGIGPRVIGLRSSRIIHPESPFALGVAIVSAIFLVYSAITTPVLVGFYWNSDPCEPVATLQMDMATDAFFLFEILLQFGIAAQRQNVIIDSPLKVAKLYLSGPFWFDLITSIPVSFIEAATVSSCADDGQEIASLRIARVLKPLRMFKLLRVIKALRLVGILDELESRFRLPTFLFRMFRVLVLVLYMVHLCACGYWLTKETAGSTADVDDFLFVNSFVPGDYPGDPAESRPAPPRPWNRPRCPACRAASRLRAELTRGRARAGAGTSIA